MFPFQSTTKSDKPTGMAEPHTPGLHANLHSALMSVSLLFFFSSADSKARKEKLEQVASFSLFGNVMSMASVQLVAASRDALLLSFKDAKVRSIILRD